MSWVRDLGRYERRHTGAGRSKGLYLLKRVGGAIEKRIDAFANARAARCEVQPSPYAAEHCP